jgi:hypothetical protein
MQPVEKVIEILFDKLKISNKEWITSNTQRFGLKTEFGHVLASNECLAYRGLGGIYSLLKLDLVTLSSTTKM